jgi:RNA polymerase sigma factor (sigma-70 family)
MEADAETALPLAKLVEGARSGNEAAWAAIVHRFAPLIVSIVRAHRLSDQDGSDVTQLVWLRLLEHLDRIREPDALPGWISATSRNACLDTIRRTLRTVPRTSFRDERSDLAEPDESILLSIDQREIREAFAQLGSACRELLALCTSQAAISYADIARSLDIPIGSIGPTRSRCLNTLRKKLTTF